MRKTFLMGMLACVLCLGFAACQKVTAEDIDVPEVVKDGSKVQFNVMRLEQMPFADAAGSRATDVRAACSRLSLAVYKGNVKVSQVNQTSQDADFGKLTLMLAAGTYRIVVIAHSGAKAPSMTDAEKIAFDGKVTDTFYYSGEVAVDGDASHDLTLRRAVAMFRLVVKDTVPTKVTMLRFYYTGGSSTFDAVHGVGCVNSKQTENRDVTQEMHRADSTVYEVYTFPKADSRELNIKVTAHDAGSNVVTETTFDKVPIERNMITQYSGCLFGGTPAGEAKAQTVSINFLSADEWGLTKYDY